MMNNRKRKKPLAEINVVPYIDVMLVLLVIFMITTPLLTQGVKVDLPKAQAESLAPKEQEPLIVTVDSKGQYFLNLADDPQQVLSADALSVRVAAELKLAKDKQEKLTVLVKGDEKVGYGKVVEAMILLQKAGVKGVGLMTEAPEQR